MERLVPRGTGPKQSLRSFRPHSSSSLPLGKKRGREVACQRRGCKAAILC